MFCIYCGKSIEEGMKFCTTCGKPVVSLNGPEIAKELIVDEIPLSEEPLTNDENIPEVVDHKQKEPQNIGEEQVPRENTVNEESTTEIALQEIQNIDQNTKINQPTNVNNNLLLEEQSIKRKKIRRVGILVAVFAGLIIAAVLFLVLTFTDLFPTSFNDLTMNKDDEEKIVEEVFDVVEDGDDYVVDEIGTIHFKSGSLAMKTEVSFTAKEDESVEGLVSDLYEITLDDIPKDDIQVELLVPEGMSEEEMVIGIEVDGYGISENSDKLDYIYLVPDMIENGYATVTVAPEYFVMEDVEESKNSNRNVVYAAGKKTYRMRAGFFSSEFWYDGGNFRVVNEKWIGSLSAESGKALLDDLEFMHQYFLDQGYTYELRNTWPFYVYIKEMNDLGGYVLSKSAYLLGKDPDRGWMELNQSFFKDGYTSGELKSLLGHEWFHMVQNNYSTADETYWFDEATACYYESAFSGGGVPSITSEYWEKAYESFFPKISTASEGYARQPLAQFLVNQYQEEILRKIYTELKTGSSLRSAVSNQAGVAFSELINPYYLALATGEIGTNQAFTINKNILSGDSVYSALGSPLSLDSPDFASLSKEDKMLPVEIGEITQTINGEGSKFVSLEFTDAMKTLFNDNTLLNLETDSGATVNLIRIKSKNTEVVTGVGSLNQINDIKKHMDDGWQYMVLLVNTEEVSQEITLTVEMEFVPTLEELQGQWPQAELMITELYVSPEFTAMLEGMSEEMLAGVMSGCEVEGENGETSEVTVDSLETIEGQSFPIVLDLVMLSDTSGTISFNEAEQALQTDEEDDGMDLEPTPFTYDNGLITGSFEEEGAVLKISIQAFYAGQNQVGLDGTFYVNYNNDMLYLNSNITGEKPINGITP